MDNLEAMYWLAIVGQRIYPVGGSSAIKNKVVSLLYGTY